MSTMVGKENGLANLSSLLIRSFVYDGTMPVLKYRAGRREKIAQSASRFVEIFENALDVLPISLPSARVEDRAFAVLYIAYRFKTNFRPFHSIFAVTR